MELNAKQIQHLQETVILIDDDPLPVLTMLWCDWANANLDRIQLKDTVLTGVENVLPVIWVFSNLYHAPPRVVFMFMKKELRKRVSLLGFTGATSLNFKESNRALGEVIKELMPVGRQRQQQVLN